MRAEKRVEGERHIQYSPQINNEHWTLMFVLAEHNTNEGNSETVKKRERTKLRIYFGNIIL